MLLIIHTISVISESSVPFIDTYIGQRIFTKLSSNLSRIRDGFTSSFMRILIILHYNTWVIIDLLSDLSEHRLKLV